MGKHAPPTVMFEDEDGVSWVSKREQILVSLCGLCGCTDDDLERDVLTAFRSFPSDGASLFITAMLADQTRPYVELILHVLTSAGLLEHGTTIRGSWLTAKGKVFLQELLDEDARS